MYRTIIFNNYLSRRLSPLVHDMLNIWWSCIGHQWDINWTCIRHITDVYWTCSQVDMLLDEFGHVIVPNGHVIGHVVDMFWTMYNKCHFDMYLDIVMDMFRMSLDMSGTLSMTSHGLVLDMPILDMFWSTLLDMMTGICFRHVLDMFRTCLLVMSWYMICAK